MSALDDLKRAERAFQRAYERAEERRAERDQALQAALAVHSQTQVANAIGVSRGRVGQLATRLRATVPASDSLRPSQ